MSRSGRIEPRLQFIVMTPRFRIVHVHTLIGMRRRPAVCTDAGSVLAVAAATIVVAVAAAAAAAAVAAQEQDQDQEHHIVASASEHVVFLLSVSLH